MMFVVPTASAKLSLVERIEVEFDRMVGAKEESASLSGAAANVLYADLVAADNPLAKDELRAYFLAYLRLTYPVNGDEK